jgi:hypothetical protein
VQCRVEGGRQAGNVSNKQQRNVEPSNKPKQVEQDRRRRSVYSLSALFLIDEVLDFNLHRGMTHYSSRPCSGYSNNNYNNILYCEKLYKNPINKSPLARCLQIYMH